jgi:hypothetical protein
MRIKRIGRIFQGLKKTNPLTLLTAGMVLSRQLSSAAAVLLERKSNPARLSFASSRSF